MRPRREIAPVIVLDQLGRLLLQQRDNIPEILCPGMICLFGGHREGDESLLECAARELHEELTLDIDLAHIEFLISREGDDYEIAGGHIRADFFVTRNLRVDDLKVTEGSLLIVSRTGVHAIYNRLTPSARYALNVFLENISG